MNVPGSLSTEKNRAPWNSALLDAYLSVIAVGILAGIVVAYARTPLHLPGHKAIFWIAPVLAMRLVTRAPAGASAGALATALTALSLGGRIAGGFVMAPLILLAGLILDLAVQLTERRNLTGWKWLLVLASAGLAGNLICFIKRLLDPLGAFFSTGNIDDLLLAGALHATFGLMAGLIGAFAGRAALACIPFANPSKMVAADRQRYRIRKQARAANERPRQQVPVIHPLAPKDAQVDRRTEEGQQSLAADAVPDPRSAVIPKKCSDTPVIPAR